MPRCFDQFSEELKCCVQELDFIEYGTDISEGF